MHAGADSRSQIQVIDSHTAGEPTRVVDGALMPTIEGYDEVFVAVKGSAYITAETTLLFDERDPFRAGIVS